MELGEALGRPAHHELLRAHVDEREGAIKSAPLNRRVELRRAEEGGDLPLAASDGIVEPLDLIGHQRDERRDDDGGAARVERGQLVADRFAAAGRPEYGHVLAGQGRLHDRGLYVNLS